MKSDLPKTLHQVCGLPMVELVGRAVKASGVERPIVVIGHCGELVQESLGESYDYAWQREQHGTGHAVLMAADLLKDLSGEVFVVAGDTPLLEAEVLSELLKAHREAGAVCTVASANVQNPRGYGRIVRASDGQLRKIVEQKDATAEEQAISEINAGLYIFNCQELLRILPGLKNTNAQGEYYLTDAIEALASEGKHVIARAFDDVEVFMGVNDRWQLAEADKALRLRVLKRHALNGVTLIDPDSIYIGLDVEIGVDTVIEPQTQVAGETVVGKGCRIGPFTKIKNCKIGDECNVYMSHLAEAQLDTGVKVGPFANLRPGTHLHDKVKIGNFVEVKNASMGEGSAANHLAYIGDSTVGIRSNIGAGTITCNYDGFRKHRTHIGDGVFVGSNSTIVAPRTIGNGAFIAAGSVITADVPEDSLAIARGRQEVKEQWAAQWRNRHR